MRARYAGAEVMIKVRGGDVLIMHLTPEYRADGSIVRIRYFGTRTEVKKFAIEQMKKRGGKGYGYSSLSREVVAELLEQHVPPPSEWES